MTCHQTRFFHLAAAMADADQPGHLCGDALQTSNPDATALVLVQNVHLPPFYPKNPWMWLIQVEAQFRNRHITSQETKHLHTVSILPADVAQEMADILAVPDPVSPFV